MALRKIGEMILDSARGLRGIDTEDRPGAIQSSLALATLCARDPTQARELALLCIGEGMPAQDLIDLSIGSDNSDALRGALSAASAEPLGRVRPARETDIGLLVSCLQSDAEHCLKTLLELRPGLERARFEYPNRSSADLVGSRDALFWATENGKERCCMLLLGQSSPDSIQQALPATSFWGDTRSSGQAGMERMCELLLKSGARPFIPEPIGFPFRFEGYDPVNGKDAQTPIILASALDDPREIPAHAWRADWSFAADLVDKAIRARQPSSPDAFTRVLSTLGAWEREPHPIFGNLASFAYGHPHYQGEKLSWTTGPAREHPMHQELARAMERSPQLFLLDAPLSPLRSALVKSATRHAPSPLVEQLLSMPGRDAALSQGLGVGPELAAFIAERCARHHLTPSTYNAGKPLDQAALARAKQSFKAFARLSQPAVREIMESQAELFANPKLWAQALREPERESLLDQITLPFATLPRGGFAPSRPGPRL